MHLHRLAPTGVIDPLLKHNLLESCCTVEYNSCLQAVNHLTSNIDYAVIAHVNEPNMMHMNGAAHSTCMSSSKDSTVNLVDPDVRWLYCNCIADLSWCVRSYVNTAVRHNCILRLLQLTTPCCITVKDHDVAIVYIRLGTGLDNSQK